jgi:Zn finger protein HypA/HybF involved in hydrogenase expression
VNLLDLAEPAAEPTVGETPTVARCRCCKRLLKAEESLGYVIGPTCRKRLGIASRQSVRLARTKPGGDCDGQTNLLETPDGH